MAFIDNRMQESKDKNNSKSVSPLALIAFFLGIFSIASLFFMNGFWPLLFPVLGFLAGLGAVIHTFSARLPGKGYAIGSMVLNGVILIFYSISVVMMIGMARPEIMELNKPPVPSEEAFPPTPDVGPEKVMTVILLGGDSIVWFTGITEPELHYTDFTAQGIRADLKAHQTRFPNRCKDVDNAPGCWDPIVVIKPTAQSRYANLMDMIDEMSISQIPKYALSEFSEQDSLLIYGDE